MLLVAPLSAAYALCCDCVHEVPTQTSLGPMPCCGTVSHSCCYEQHGSVEPTAEWWAEAPTVLRSLQPAIVEALDFTPQVKVQVVKVVRAPRAERPPGALCRELSFHQSWLI